MAEFYNTTRIKGARLKDAKKRAKSQDEIVLGVFVESPYSWLTSEEIHDAAFTAKTPLTSVRRSLTHLSKLGLIDKSKSAIRDSSYGAACHSWRLSEIGRSPTERVMRLMPTWAPPSNPTPVQSEIGA